LLQSYSSMPKRCLPPSCKRPETNMHSLPGKDHHTFAGMLATEKDHHTFAGMLATEIFSPCQLQY
jgi:hypothetical protein